jgi:Ecdysteroid kinase-like family
MKIPSKAEEIDADWLTLALAEKYPGTEVIHVAQGTFLHGTASKIRLMLDYNDAGHAYGLPPTMWFKGGLEAHSVTEQMRAIYATEAQFYQQFAPKLSMDLPHCFASVFDPDTGCSAILLDDLLKRNARFNVATRPCGPELARSVLTELAKLHGSFWKSPALSENELMKTGLTKLIDFLDAYMFTPENWQRCVALPRAKYLPPELKDRETMSRLVHDLLEYERQNTNTLLHADDHLGNVVSMPGDKAILLDWQAAMAGHWAHDVAYFLTAAMTVEDRRKHERDLISHYAQQLNEAGGQVHEDTAWYEYRRHALYTCCWFICNPEWVKEDITAACSDRAFIAFTDLETIKCFE